MELFTGNNVDTLQSQKKFDNLARLAALVFGTPIGIISLRLADRHIRIGGQGLNLREVSRTLDLGEFADAPLWFEDVQRESDPRLEPVIRPTARIEMPVRFFASAPIVDRRFRRVGLVKVIDYWPRFLDKRLAPTLEIIAEIVGELLYHPLQSAYHQIGGGTSDATLDQLAVAPVGGFNEDLCKPAESDLSIAENFLIDTLIPRRSIFSRNGVSFVSLRAWRMSVKKHQIHALREVKAAPTPAFIDTVSQEIVGGLNRLVGERPARIVTHIPCGHSRNVDCLSCLLAKRIAAHLNLPFVSAFKPNFSTGKSHPKANLIRPAMEIDAPIVDPVLLIDDVASSGRHIEEAVNLLRQSTDVVLPVAWIGGKASAARIAKAAKQAGRGKR